MIQAKELRIGNYYLFEQQISQITSGWQISFIRQAVYPIPLVEELLLKFGFDKHLTKLLYIKENFYLHQYAFSIDGHSYCFKYNDYRSAEISYVHQLQNLYFALTNQELTLP